MASPDEIGAAAKRLLERASIVHRYRPDGVEMDYVACDPSDIETVARGALDLAAEVERMKDALRHTYGYAAAIQRMTAFTSIGFRCSLIREVVSRALPDDEAKRLHDETEIILDALMSDAALTPAPTAPPQEADRAPD